MTDTDRGTPSVPPWVVDVSMAVAVSTVLISVVALSQVGTDHVPSLASYLFVAAFGVVLLVRRQLPRTVLAVSVLGTFAYYVLEYPPIGVALPVAGALFSTAERGRLGWAVGGGSVVFAVSLYFRLRDDPQPVGYLLGTESVSTLALIAAAISLGYGVHARRRHLAQQRHITQLAEQVEREHISRELHDSVGHGLSVISLHAAVAREEITPTILARLGEFGVSATRPELLDGLTGREREVLERVGHGETNAEVGAHLHISPATARTYVSRLLSKLHARDRSRLVVLAYESGLVTPGGR